MANYVIVCGGTGKGLVTERANLGFEGVLQIDVQAEIVRCNDGKVTSVALPVQNVTEMALNNVNSLSEYRDRLRVDVATADVEKKSILERQINHVEAAIRQAGVAAITQGMSQNPIIGHSYATRSLPTNEIKQKIDMMLSWKLQNDREAVFWLVASTCGGTGNGIVMHVADIVEELCRNKNLNATIKLIRIGSGTYSSLNQGVHLATMWSVLTDFGYLKQHETKSKTGQTASQVHVYYLDLPDVGAGTAAKPPRELMVASAFKAIVQKNLNASFTSVLNNLGQAPKVVFARIGEWGKQFNGDSIYHHTLSQLNKALQHLINPEQRAVLSESVSITWRGIEVVNDHLVSSEVDTNVKKSISNQANQSFVNGITDMKFVSSGYKNKTDGRLISVIETDDWKQFTALKEKILTERDVATIIKAISIKLNLTNAQVDVIFTKKIDHQSDPNYIGSAEFTAEVRLAQRTIVRLEEELLGTDTEVGLLAQLYAKWNKLLPAKLSLGGLENIDVPVFGKLGYINASDSTRRTAIESNFKEFLVSYHKVDCCLRLIQQANMVINDARTDLNKVLNVVNEQSKAHAVTGDELTESVDFEVVLGRSTWLRDIYDVLQGDIQQQIDTGAFRTVVEKGARGLTEDGLRYVLELPKTVSNAQIVAQINSNVGSNNAVWWQGINPPDLGADNRFVYRVFPQLPDSLFNSLVSESQRWANNGNQIAPEYIPVRSDSFGLKVYAIECAAPGIIAQDQVVQVISGLIQWVNKGSSLYLKAPQIMPKDEEPYFISMQCLRSTGLPVYCPETFSNGNNNQKMLYEVIHSLKDYFTIVS